MAIRKILALGEPREKILRTKAKKVTRFDPYLERLISDMWETMRVAPGVGLAAPQVGESIRALVAEYEDEHVALINPEILKAEGEELGTEGCLSIPGYVGDNVPRALTITVKGRDPKGKEIRLHAEGWWARILQHEIDHLDGILFTDRIKPQDVREVTDEDIPDEGAPADQPTKARAKANGRAANGARADRAQAKTAAESADPPTRQGTIAETAAKTAASATHQPAAAAESADPPARQSAARADAPGERVARGGVQGGRG